ncbi:unnamed protein product [Caenorhabditis auriculariae]|uniref:Major facilitator superfamily (MFS) profile domain-containing protein n=1 Tax=Caenorhabditis auriculariae TaxID=2777116 RepID=A0A8S1HSF3_9PELO|nr:unnamed protein product [Caenorhabditis auriculariae]
MQVCFRMQIVKPVPLFSIRSMRLWMCALMATGLYASVAMRVNLSMAIVCMVNSTAFPQHHYTLNDSKNAPLSMPEAVAQCGARFDDDVASAAHAGYTGDLMWSPTMQSMLLSATFYGAIVTVVFSGYVADRFGPKFILLAATLVYVIVTLLTPWLARYSYQMLFVARIFMGFGEGFIFPSLGSLAGRWFAPTERSTAAALYSSGNQIGSGLTSLIASLLCASTFGWPSIFYSFGLISLAWCIVWWIFASNFPSSNRWISQEEVDFLTANVGGQKKGQDMGRVPWRQLLTSLPLWVAVMCQFTYTLQTGIMQSFLPTYLKDDLVLPLSSNGIYTMVPFLAQLISKNILGIVADYMKRNKIMGYTATTKMFQAIGSYGSALCLFGMVFFSQVAKIRRAPFFFLAIYGVVFSAGICGFFTSVLCIAPPYSGILTSIAQIMAVCGNLTGPLLVSFIQKTGFLIEYKWSMVFLFCALSNIFSGTLFVLFGSANAQEWAKPEKQILEERLRLNADSSKESSIDEKPTKKNSIIFIKA